MKESLLDRCVDRLNPILLKEVRQLVRSRFVSVIFMLLLGAMLLCGGFVLIVSEIGSALAEETFTAGRMLFSTFMGVLTFSTVLFVPAYAGIRFARERGSGNADLLYISTLTPPSIVWGKIQGVLVIAGLLFGACMPFMVFTYLLRGIDLLQVFVSLVGLLVVVVLLSQAALFLAVIPVNKVFRVILALGAAIGLFSSGMGITVTVAAFGAGRGGFSGGSAEYWAVQLTLLAIALAGMGLFYFMTVAMISPVRANRAMPVRVFFSIVWLAMLIPSVLWDVFSSGDEAVMVWVAVSSALLCMAMPIVASEREPISNRIRRAVPKGFLGRAISFPFFSGPLSGLCWVVLLITLTLGVGYVYDALRGSGGDEVIRVMALVALYSLCYTSTAIFIRRMLLRRLLSETYTWVVAGLVLAISCLVPTTIGFFAGQSVAERGSIWRLGNVFFSGVESEQWRHLSFCLVWLVAAGVANSGFLFGQIRQFKRLTPVETPVFGENEQEATVS